MSNTISRLRLADFWHGSTTHSFSGSAGVATSALALLLLAHSLGPWSYLLRRSSVAFALAGLLIVHFRNQRGFSKNLFVVGVAITTIVLLYVAASWIAALAFVLTLAIINVFSEYDWRDGSFAVSHVAHSFVAVYFSASLLPRLDRLSDAASILATAYLRFVTGREFSVAPGAFGAAPVMFGSIFLLWRWRLAGGGIRLVIGVALPVLWFLSLPLALMPQADGATGVLLFGVIHGSSWLIAAFVFDAFWACPHRPDAQAREIPRRPSFAHRACVAGEKCGIVPPGTFRPPDRVTSPVRDAADQ